MQISSTQDEAFTRCKRLWWLSYPKRLPQIARTNFDFGTVLHAVCERFLLADDTGRDRKTGKQVELFPDGWDTLEDKKGKRTLGAFEAGLIQKLVKKAIEDGVLERYPNREVEVNVKADLIPGVTFTGFVDVLMPGEVQDHKTTSSMRWAKTPKSLAESHQMLNYAKFALDADPTQENIRLRHNVFLKDAESPKVVKVETQVSKDVVLQNWERLMRQAQSMLSFSQANIPLEDWRKVEGPSSKGACSAYGGCSFQRICQGRENPDIYRARVENANENAPQNHNPKPTFAEVWGRVQKTPTANDMNIFERRKAAQAAQAGDTPAAPLTAPKASPAQAPAATATKVAEAPPAAAVSTEGMTPWADPNCKACGENPVRGLNSKGSACRICDLTAKKNGRPSSADYIIENDGEGNVVWEAKDGSGGGSATLTGEVTSAAKIALPAAKAAEKPEPKPLEIEVEAPANAEVAIAEANEEETQEAEEELEAEKPKRGRPKKDTKKEEDKTGPGRPKASFTLYVNCTPIGPTREIVTAASLFDELTKEMAEAGGVDSFYDLDTWKRREMFGRCAFDLAERYNRKHIVAVRPDSDLKAFVDALKSVALPGRVIEGIVG